MVGSVVRGSRGGESLEKVAVRVGKCERRREP